MSFRTAFGLVLMVLQPFVLLADPPTLHFVAAPPGAEVKLTANERLFTHELVIENSDKISLQNVTVEATRLVGPKSLALACSIDSQPCATAFGIAPYRSKTLLLTADIDTPGAYSAVISVVGPASRHSISLAVTRPESKFPLQLLLGEKAAGVTGSLTVRILLQETSGKRADLDLPTLRLTRQAPDGKGQNQASFTPTFHNDDEKRTPITGPWMVTKNASKALLVEVKDLKEPGEYTGFVRLTSPDGSKPLDIPVKIWIKHGMCVAAFFLGLGVALSFGIRLYVRSVRPTLEYYRKAAFLMTDVKAVREEIEKRFDALDEREAALLNDYETRLMKLAERLETGEATSAETDLAEIDRKLSMTVRWVNTRRRIAALPQTVRTSLETSLAAVTTFLESRGAEGADAAQATLNKLDDEIEDAIRIDLTQRIDKLLEGAAASTLIPGATRTTIKQMAEEAKGLERITDVRAKLREAETAWADAAGQAFQEQLNNAKLPPLGFDQLEWNALKQDTRVALDAGAKEAEPGRRIEALRTAFSAYVGKLVAKLRDYAVSRVGRIEKDPNIELLKKEDLKTRLAAIIANLDAAEKDTTEGNMDKAATAATTAAADLLRVMQEAPGLLGEPGASEAAPTPTEIGLGAAIVSFLGLNPRMRRLDVGTAQRITRVLATIDSVVFLVALAAAILLGLTLLWSPDVDWGSAQDFMVAVLWGLGLHQVSNSAFEGISGLLGKFK